MNDPRVTVVIPVRNRAALLRRALNSVRAQTVGDWEAVVVDDASSDRPEEVVAALGDRRIRVLRRPLPGGPGAAREAGIAAARGRFAAFLDSDDEWMPEKLGWQLRRLEAPGGPAVHVAATIQRGHTGDRNRPGMARQERIASFLYVRNGFAQASGVMMPVALARAAGCGAELRQYEDHLALIRAEALGGRVEVSGPPLSIQHVDPRPDRLGMRDDAARAWAFLDAAGPLLTEEERLGFELRCLGRALAAEAPAEALRLAGRGLRRPALIGAALKLAVRAAA